MPLSFLCRETAGLLSASVFLCALLAAGTARAAHPTATPPAAMPPGTGLVIAAFGTTVPQARADYALIEAAVREKWPHLPLEWGFSADFVRRRMREKEGLDAPSVSEALARLKAREVRQAAILALYVAPGQEYDEIKEMAAAASGQPEGLNAITVSAPLIGSPDSTGDAVGADDTAEVARALMAAFPAQGSGILFVGHGSPRPAGAAAYAALARVMQASQGAYAVGVLEGEPAIAAAITAMKEAGASGQALVVPLLVVAGDHARRDLIGGEGSVAAACEAAGFTPQVVLTGLPHVPAITTLWLARLEAALTALAALP